MFTPKFKPEPYININWKRLLGYYLPYLIAGRRYGPIWKHRYNIKHGKTGKRYWLCKICHKKKAYIQYIYLDLGTTNYLKHIQEEHNISNDSIN